MTAERIFYVLAGMLVAQGLISLREGFRYLSYVNKSLAERPSDFTPAVAVFAPCKGIDEGMGDFLRSLFELDYPNYRIVFVVETEYDPAIAEIERMRGQYPNIRSKCIIAGRSSDCGQKVHNLLAAIAVVEDDVEAFAFVDSDVRLRREWLHALVSPLKDTEVGATTGYRWFIPTDDRFASLLLAVWNGSIATALGGHRNNFAWGGSMAILRSTFDRIDARRFWRGALSDDYALTRAVKAANLYVKFVPQCLTPSFSGCSFPELLEFTTRQIIITRVYSIDRWILLLASNILFNSIFFWGLALSARSLQSGETLWPSILIGIIYILSVWKGRLRVKAVRNILVEYEREIERRKSGYYLLAPAISLVYLYNLIVSAMTKRITWRGVKYELRSANETVIERSQ